MTPDVCPNCGAEVPARARACPECGADENTGWSDEARYDALGLPDHSFDYEEYTKQEFGEGRRHGVPGIRLVWQVIAALIVAALLYFLWRRWF